MWQLISPLHRNCLLWSPHLVLCLWFLACSCPCPSPSPWFSVISPPSIIYISALSCQTPQWHQYQHTSIYASSSSHPHVLKHLGMWPFLPLSLSLLSPGDLIPNLACRRHSALQFASSLLLFLTCCSPFYVCPLELDFALEGCHALPPPSYICAQCHSSSNNSVKFPTFRCRLYCIQHHAACHQLASSSVCLLFPPLPPWLLCM